MAITIVLWKNVGCTLHLRKGGIRVSRKKVLVVEDSADWHKIWRDQLDGQVLIISALTVQEGERMFMEHPDFCAIVMDACVPGHTPTTLFLTSEIRETFQGPMIAVSSISEYREELVEAGCNHSCPKEDLSRRLMEILHLEPVHAH